VDDSNFDSDATPSISRDAEIMARNVEAWEEWGELDPLWAVLTSNEGKHGRWDLEKFFASGRETIDSLMRDGANFGVPSTFERGLDFGCGVGRLTRALAAHVDHVIGIDVSSSMIDEARSLNAGIEGLEFLVNQEPDLQIISDGSIDVVCSLLVLQHVPSIPVIENYLSEFVRILAPGGFLVFNLPVRVPPEKIAGSIREVLRPRKRLSKMLRKLGVSAEFLYRRFNWTPEMPMNALGQERVTNILTRAGGRVLEAKTVEDGRGVDQVFYFVSC